MLGDQHQRVAVEFGDLGGTGEHVVELGYNGDLHIQRIDALDDAVQCILVERGLQVDDYAVAFVGLDVSYLLLGMDGECSRSSGVTPDEQRKQQTEDVTDAELQQPKHSQRYDVAMVVLHLIIDNDDKECTECNNYR